MEITVAQSDPSRGRKDSPGPNHPSANTGPVISQSALLSCSDNRHVSPCDGVFFLRERIERAKERERERERREGFIRSLYMYSLMSFFNPFFWRFSGNCVEAGTVHVLKGTHICCALGAGRQHCYWGPNLIFSLFWSSTFNHWLLGGSTFSPEIVRETKENVIAACLWNYTFEERPISSCAEGWMDSGRGREVDENHNTT